MQSRSALDIPGGGFRPVPGLAGWRTIAGTRTSNAGLETVVGLRALGVDADLARAQQLLQIACSRLRESARGTSGRAACRLRCRSRACFRPWRRALRPRRAHAAAPARARCARGPASWPRAIAADGISAARSCDHSSGRADPGIERCKGQQHGSRRISKKPRACQTIAVRSSATAPK